MGLMTSTLPAGPSPATPGGHVTHGRLGRKPKGNRKTMIVRSPVEFVEQLTRAAAAAGYCLSDYVTVCLARSHDYELPAPVPVARPAPEVQQELPISA